MKPGNKKEFPFTPARFVDSSIDPYVVCYIWDAQKKKSVRKRVSLRGDTVEEKRKDAVQLIKEINQKLKDGWHIDEQLPAPAPEPETVVPVAKALTFEQAVAYYKTTKAVEFKGNTEELNDHYFRHLRKFLVSKGKSEIALKDVSVPIMFEFFDTTTVGARFRNNMLGFFKSFFTFYISRELLGKSPCAAIKNVRVDASEDHRPFNAQQAKDIRAAILDNGDEQLWLFCAFIYFLFVRPGEELRLMKVGDILTDQIRVTSGNAKNRKTGFIDIPPGLEQLIKQHRLRYYSPTDYVFTIAGHPGPVHLGENYIYKRHRKIMENLGLFGHDYDVYSWKPTGAIVLYKATKDIMLVQRHCRHSTPDQTYTYLRKQGLVFEGKRVSEFPELWE